MLSTGSSFTHRFSDQGQHTVTLTATSRGVAAHADVTFTVGTGQSFTAPLYWNSSSPTQHVIRLVATDSLGHTAATSVTITVGTFS